MPKSTWLILCSVAALAGFFFAATSTSDFVAHLDRQVHGIHCGFFPGAPADMSGTTGCHVTLMSPYSSVFRTSVWGGIPVALPAMAVFAYLVGLAWFIVLSGRARDSALTGYLLLSTGLPVLTSAVFAYLSFSQLGAACKLCIGIYVSSVLSAIFAFLSWRSAKEQSANATAATVVARRELNEIDLGDDAGDTVADHGNRKVSAARPVGVALGVEGTERNAVTPTAFLFILFLLGVAAVVIPTAAYAMFAPNFERFAGSCGDLAHPEDPHGVLIPLGPQTRSINVVEVFDPLCPACRGFERRFSGLTATEQVSRKILLFPLDESCNWMVRGHSVHPGACAVSKAILCAEGQAEEVINWAFAEQERLHAAGQADPNAVARLTAERFPNLRSCMNAPRTRYKLDQALNWAVANQLPVSTPQAYVNNTRVCEADTDLGLDYMLSRLIARAGGTR